MRKLLTALLLTFATAVVAATMPYDESADAPTQVRQALDQARQRNVPTLIIFGANWCEDCRALDRSLHTPANAALVDKSFVVVKVDVGNFDRNLALDATYGDPIKRGIPAAVIVSADNRVVYSTKAGELADARRMSDSGVYEFFKAAVESAHQAH